MSAPTRLFTRLAIPPASRRAQAIITVTANQPPLAKNDTVSLPEDGSVSSPSTPLNVLANDSDPEGGPLQITGVGRPQHGTVTTVRGGVGGA